MNNLWNDKEGRYEIPTITIESVDKAVFDFFDRKANVHVQGTDKENKKVNVLFASGERWNLIRKNGLRDENKTLILPLITIQRMDIDNNAGLGGLGTQVKEITIASKPHTETSNFQNLFKQRNTNGYPQEREGRVVREYLTIPYPKFCTVFYQITFWSQYQTQMNEIIEKVMHKSDFYVDSFVMPVDFDEKNPDGKGKGFYFNALRDGTIVTQSNIEEFSGQERILKYSFNIKIPTYLILNPKDSVLSYGKDDEGKNVVYKSQNTVDISLKEQVLTAEEFFKKFG